MTEFRRYDELKRKIDWNIKNNKKWLAKENLTEEQRSRREQTLKECEKDLEILESNKTIEEKEKYFFDLY